MPRPATVGKIAEALNVPFDWVMIGSGDDPVTTKSYNNVSIAMPKSMTSQVARLASIKGVTMEQYILDVIERSVKEG